MKVLQLTREQRAAALSDEVSEERTGVFTSGIVATSDGQKIALFFTGARHAGENLGALLERRATQLPAPSRCVVRSRATRPMTLKRCSPVV